MAGKWTAFLVVVTFVIHLMQAAMIREIIIELPGHRGQCYVGDHFFAVGESYNAPLKCMTYDCSYSGTNLFMTGATCGSIGAAPPCKVVPGNRNLPYPACCPRISCPD